VKSSIRKSAVKHFCGMCGAKVLAGRLIVGCGCKQQEEAREGTCSLGWECSNCTWELLAALEVAGQGCVCIHSIGGWDPVTLEYSPLFFYARTKLYETYMSFDDPTSVSTCA
jgi:hypothetical protein